MWSYLLWSPVIPHVFVTAHLRLGFGYRPGWRWSLTGTITATSGVPPRRRSFAGTITAISTVPSVAAVDPHRHRKAGCPLSPKSETRSDMPRDTETLDVLWKIGCHDKILGKTSWSITWDTSCSCKATGASVPNTAQIPLLNRKTRNE